MTPAYMEGFITKCAQAGIDPEALVKHAQIGNIGAIAASGAANTVDTIDKLKTHTMYADQYKQQQAKSKAQAELGNMQQMYGKERYPDLASTGFKPSPAMTGQQALKSLGFGPPPSTVHPNNPNRFVPALDTSQQIGDSISDMLWAQKGNLERDYGLNTTSGK